MSELDKNSLLYWFPKIKNLPIPQPATAIYMIKPVHLKVLRQEGLPHGIEDEVDKANPFGYPFFLRSDQASNKHFWEIASFVESKDKLKTCIFETISHNLMADIFGLPFVALVMRKYIPMSTGYHAFRGMPVNPERRYFFKDHKLVCHHPYWVENAIREYGDTKLPENWVELSKEMNTETAEEVELLSSYVRQVANLFDGFWSVDFCKAKDGRWILIDCALGNQSWHPKDCPHYEVDIP